jgi:hypothetical protein
LLAGFGDWFDGLPPGSHACCSGADQNYADTDGTVHSITHTAQPNQHHYGRTDSSTATYRHPNSHNHPITHAYRYGYGRCNRYNGR